MDKSFTPEDIASEMLFEEFEQGAPGIVVFPNRAGGYGEPIAGRRIKCDRVELWRWPGWPSSSHASPGVIAHRAPRGDNPVLMMGIDPGAGGRMDLRRHLSKAVSNPAFYTLEYARSTGKAQAGEPWMVGQAARQYHEMLNELYSTPKQKAKNELSQPHAAEDQALSAKLQQGPRDIDVESDTLDDQDEWGTKPIPAWVMKTPEFQALQEKHQQELEELIEQYRAKVRPKAAIMQDLKPLEAAYIANRRQRGDCGWLAIAKFGTILTANPANVAEVIPL